MNSWSRLVSIIQRTFWIFFSSRISVTPFTYKYELSEIVYLFLRISFDIDARNVEGYNVLHKYKLCKYDKNLPLIKTLIGHGANPKDHEMTAFIIFSSNRCTNIVRFLLKNGVNFNERDFYGRNGYLKTISSDLMAIKGDTEYVG